MNTQEKQEDDMCLFCDGDGYVEGDGDRNYLCPQCKGTGFVKR